VGMAKTLEQAIFEELTKLDELKLPEFKNRGFSISAN
jgi:hypothetical protein